MVTDKANGYSCEDTDWEGHEGASKGDGNVLCSVLGDGYLRWHLCGKFIKL